MPCSSCCPRSSGSAPAVPATTSARARASCSRRSERIRRTRREPSTACVRSEPSLAAMLESMLGATFAPTLISAGEKINVIPARAEFAVDCRLPPGLGVDVAERRARELLGDTDGLELAVTEAVVGNGSRDRHAADGRDPRMGRRGRPRRHGRADRDARVHRLAAGGAPRSRTASPTGSSPSATSPGTRRGR